MIKIYKSVIVFLLASSLFLHFFPWGYHGEAGQSVSLGLSGAGAWIDRGAASLISNTLFFGYIAAYSGMLFFRSWARMLLILISLLGGLLIPAYGISIQFGFESLLGFYTVLGDGFIIAISLFSPLKARFDGRK